MDVDEFNYIEWVESVRGEEVEITPPEDADEAYKKPKVSRSMSSVKVSYCTDCKGYYLPVLLPENTTVTCPKCGGKFGMFKDQRTRDAEDVFGESWDSET